MDTEPANMLFFLGPIGGPEIIMIFLMLLFLAAPVVLVVVLVVSRSNRKLPQIPLHPSTPPPLPEAAPEANPKDL